jgi:hypothetical protein
MGGYVKMALLAATFAAIISAFFYGQSVGETACIAASAKAVAKDAEKTEGRIVKAQGEDDRAAIAETARRDEVRGIIREVPKFIDRPVYRNVCIDAGGVQLIERAVRAANGGRASGGRPADPAGPVRDAAGERGPAIGIDPDAG